MSLRGEVSNSGYDFDKSVLRLAADLGMLCHLDLAESVPLMSTQDLRLPRSSLAQISVDMKRGPREPRPSLT